MEPFYIGFTGHRNTITDEDELEKIHKKYPQAIWIHGDCPEGFDRQVRDYAKKHNIKQKKLPGKPGTYLSRNRQIVGYLEICNGILFTCYDGRTYGGTYYTVNYAKGRQIKVKKVTVIKG